MYITLILGIFSVFFSYISRDENKKWGLKFSFLLIFIFLALRYNFGNDYLTYLNNFSGISLVDFDELSDYFSTNEPGWMLINWLFRYLGFFSLTIFLAAMSCYIYYNFIIYYVERKFYWLAVFIYIFNPVFMIINLSAMRQAVAISIFIYSIKFIINSNPIKYIILIVMAGFFHYTAILLLPIYLIKYLNIKIRPLIGVFLAIIYLSIFVFGDFLSPYLKVVISAYSEKYEYYQNAGVANSGLGFMYYSALFILVLYYEKFQNREIAILFKISIIGFLIIPMALIVDMTGRFGIYFSPATIAVFPAIASKMKASIRIIFLVALIFFTLFQFLLFFNSENYYEYFFDYQTIFSSEKWR